MDGRSKTPRDGRRERRRGGLGRVGSGRRAAHAQSGVCRVRGARVHWRTSSSTPRTHAHAHKHTRSRTINQCVEFPLLLFFLKKNRSRTQRLSNAYCCSTFGSLARSSFDSSPKGASTCTAAWSASSPWPGISTLPPHRHAHTTTSAAPRIRARAHPRTCSHACTASCMLLSPLPLHRDIHAGRSMARPSTCYTSA